MAFNGDILSSLSEEILCEIFSSFLSLRDISRLDRAICNRNKRSVLLACLQSEGCIFSGDRKRFSSAHEISWMSIRNIKIRKLTCSKVTDSLADKIAYFSIHLQKLSLYVINDINLSEIVVHCPNIKDLDICCI
jgi:hypothetical protein